jgi:RNA polymerase sigma-70 factor (ECF subfamily)
MPDHPAYVAAPETAIAGRRLYAALDGLRVKDREAFVLRYLEDLPLVEAAAVAGVSLATMKRRIERATERLRRYIDRDVNLKGQLEALARRHTGTDDAG